jgi:hypothetical protein
MNQWLPISQLVSIGVPPLPSNTADFAASGSQLPPHTASPTPLPPGLNWGFLLLLAVLTFGLFGWIWSLVLARWVRKIDARHRAIPLLISALAISVVAVTTLLSTTNGVEQFALVALLQLVALVLFEIAVFELRKSILQHYENLGIPLSLSSTATVFFNVVYFQFKFNRIHHTQNTPLWTTVHHS